MSVERYSTGSPYRHPDDDSRSSRNSTAINVLTFLCPLTASFSSAFGTVTLAGQSWYPFKIVVPMLALTLGWRCFDLLLHRGSYPFLLLALAGWGMIGIAWTTDRTAGLKEVSVLAFAAIVASAMAVAVRAPEGLAAMLRGWLAGVALTSMVAIWELVTGQHLDTPFVGDRDSVVNGLLLSTFANPNNFGAFLVISLPFCVIVATGRATPWRLGATDVIVGRILLGLIPVLMMLSGSRFALIGGIVFAGTYLLLNRKERSAWRVGGVLVIGGFGLLAGAAATGQEVVRKFGNLAEPAPFSQNSAEIRINLILNGLTFVQRTAGIGIGPGGYEAAMSEGEVPFHVRGGVLNAHNFWIELLAQYGVIGALLLGAVLVSAASTYWASARLGSRSLDARISTVMLAGFAGYFFASMTASSYVNAPENWMFVAGFLALAPVIAKIRRSTDGRSTPRRSLVGSADRLIPFD